MSFGRCVRSKKQDFETDLRGWMQVCQKVGVVGKMYQSKLETISSYF